VIETGDKSRRIKRMMTEDYIVRNDEVVGSIPTSSTNLLNYLPRSCALCEHLKVPFVGTVLDHKLDLGFRFRRGEHRTPF
jgi:hypothetical protein